MPDDLAASISALQDSIAKSDTPQGTPRQPTLDDSMHDLMMTFEQVTPKAKEALFNARRVRMEQPINAPPGGTVTATAQGVLAGLVKGVTSPVAAFLPDAFNDKLDAWEEDSARKQLGLQARSQYKTTFQATPVFSRALISAPGTAGEFAGSVIPFIPAMSAAHDVFEVGQAASFMEKALRTTAAATTTGGLLGAAARLDPGESRLAKVAKDAAVMGAFEMVGIPAMFKAWKEESPGLLEAIEKGVKPPSIEPPGPRTPPSPPTNAVAEKLGRKEVSPEMKAIASQITAVRSGVPASPEVVDNILEAAKGDPALAKTPVVLQAAKQKEAASRLVNPQTIIDPLLESENGTLKARVQVTIDGQQAPPQDIHFDAANPQHVQNQIGDMLKGVRALASTGADVRLESITAATQEDAQEILNALKGKRSKPPSMDPTKQGVPGKAPANTVAANGDMPSVGDVVKIVEPGKPLVQATVLDRPLSQEEAAALSEKRKKEFEFYRDMGGRPLMEGRPIPEQGFWDRVYRSGLEPPTPRDNNVSMAGQDFFPRGEAPAVTPGPVTPPPEEVGRGEAETALARSTIKVELPDKTVREVPLAQVQVPLEVGVKQSTRLMPHLDGSTRRGIIHVDQGGLSLEQIGGPQTADQNYFRSNMFTMASEDTQWGRDPRLYIKPGGELSITIPGSAPDDVRLATARRAAQVLLRNGVAGDSAVNVARLEMPRLSPGVMVESLRDLSQVPLPLVDLGKLQDDAAARGLKAIPFGDQMTLMSKRGRTRVFQTGLEAHEAVLRMPVSTVDKKVEASLEQAWKIGSERAYDPDVDINRFLPIDMQENGIKEVARGQRPLFPVYTSSPKDLTATVEKLNEALSLPEGTLKARLLPALNSGKRYGAVVYNEDGVALQAAKYRDALKYLSVTSRDPGEMLDALSRKGQGHGIYVLSGREGNSAALYAKWRDEGQKEFWEKGRLEYDSAGPYRRYNKDAQQLITYRGAGDEHYVPADASDVLSPPEGVHFSADSGEKPRPMEEMAPHVPNFGKEPPRFDTEHLPPGEFKDETGPLQKIFGLRFRPVMELSKDLQSRTNVPFYDWYRAVEEGRHAVAEVANPILANFREMAKPLNFEQRKWAQLLFEARIAGADVKSLEDKLAAPVKTTATLIEQQYRNFFKGEGFTDKDVEDFFSLFPHIRKADGDFRYVSTGRTSIPRIGMLLSKDLENGSIMLDNREVDFQRIANRIVRGTATERYLQPSWNRVVTEMEAFKQAKRIPADLESWFTSYLSEVLHMPDALQQSSARAVRQVFSKLGGRISEVESQDVVSMLTQMNTFTNMAWSPGQVLRNFFQTLQTSLPIVGTKDTVEGWRYALKWWKDPELQKEMVRLRVLQPNAVYEPLQEITRLIEGGGGKVDKALDTFFNQGTRWHTNAFDFNKVVAYRSQYVRARRVGQEYLDKKIDWSTFLEKSRLDMRDTKNGPFIQEIKGLLDKGKLEDMANRAGEEFAKSTQFVYTRGNAPYVMQSTLGRFLLQYGTWPAWYAENLRNMVARGSVKNRLAATSRWLGVQSAMFGTANALFGVDLARWTFFSPLGYQGGPFAQMGLQAVQTMHAATTPGSNDPVDRIARARLASSVVRQLTPLPVGTALNVGKAAGFMLQGSWPDAARQLFGLPPAKGPLIQ